MSHESSARTRNISPKVWFAATLMSIAGAALADSTHVVAVTATVRQVCRIMAAPTLAFRPSDNATGGEVRMALSNGTLRCTKGSTFTVVSENAASEFTIAGAGNRARPSAGFGAECVDRGECVGTAMNQVGTGLGLGEANNIPFGVGGTVALADYANEAEPTLVVTVNP